MGSTDRSALRRWWKPAAVLVATALVGCQNHGSSKPQDSAQSSAPESTGPRLITGRHISPVPVASQDVGSNPANMIPVLDGKFAISTDIGYRQALWSIRAEDGKGISHVTFTGRRGNLDASNGLYYGLAASSDGKLYAAQGNHDSIAVFQVSPEGELTATQTINTKKHDFPTGLALDDHGRLYVANNDPQSTTLPEPSSVAIYDADSEKELGRYRFTDSFAQSPNFPLAVCVLHDGSKLYVASERDGAVYVLNTTDPAHITMAGKISTGSHPGAIIFDKAQRRMFVANASSDTVSIVDTQTDQITGTVLLRPIIAKDLPGATPTGLALSADEKWLYASLGDMNAIAVVDIGDLQVESYISAGWYPTGVVLAPDGKHLLVANAKGTAARNLNPPPGKRHQSPLNIIEGNVQLLAIPTKDQFKASAEKVLADNRLTPRHLSNDNPLKSISLHSGKIQHVIYIVKENRAYDQILGDISKGNGDPKYVIFGRDVTPNLHAIAERFVLLDNFYDCGEVSGDGWVWSTQAMANEYVIRNVPYGYSGRGRHFDYEGENNGYPAGGFPAKDANGKPSSDLPVFKNGAEPITDVAESPGGHLWDLAEKNGRTYRNFGFFENDGGKTRDGKRVAPENWPSATGLLPAGHDLAGRTDIDFRRFDLDYPDSDAPHLYYEKTHDPRFLWGRTKYGTHDAPCRFAEWNREFQEMLKKDPSGNSVPNLMTVRMGDDHTFGASANKHTPRSMVADNDFGVGELVEAVSRSPIWHSTAIFVIEDDAQDGPDHVDTHRSTCYVISPWIKRGRVDHTFHNTASCLRTIEDLLDLPPMCQYDATSSPIMDWDSAPHNIEPFQATMPAEKYAMEHNPDRGQVRPVSPELSLLEQSAKMDFSVEDRAPAQELDEIIWQTVKGPGAKMPRTPRGYMPASGKQKDDDD